MRLKSLPKTISLNAWLRRLMGLFLWSTVLEFTAAWRNVSNSSLTRTARFLRNGNFSPNSTTPRLQVGKTLKNLQDAFLQYSSETKTSLTRFVIESKQQKLLCSQHSRAC